MVGQHAPEFTIYYLCINVKFHYLYRDGANYKQYNFEVFSNNDGLLIEEIESHIKSALIEDSWFYTDKWRLKDIHLYNWDESIDHRWHEFDFVENTNEMATVGDIPDFIKLINNQSEIQN